MDRKEGGQTDRKEGGQTDRKEGGQMDRKEGGQTGSRLSGGETCWLFPGLCSFTLGFTWEETGETV